MNLALPITFTVTVMFAAAIPVFAQTPTKPPPPPQETPEARTCDLELSRERGAHTADIKDAFGMMDQLRAAQSQVETLTKERDDLKKQVADLTPKAPDATPDAKKP